jgi:hypothetical protein
LLLWNKKRKKPRKNKKQLRKKLMKRQKKPPRKLKKIRTRLLKRKRRMTLKKPTKLKQMRLRRF